jgi:hypothetical protein
MSSTVSSKKQEEVCASKISASQIEGGNHFAGRLTADRHIRGVIIKMGTSAYDFDRKYSR